MCVDIKKEKKSRYISKFDFESGRKGGEGETNEWMEYAKFCKHLQKKKKRKKKWGCVNERMFFFTKERTSKKEAKLAHAPFPN